MKSHRTVVAATAIALSLGGACTKSTPEPRTEVTPSTAAPAPSSTPPVGGTSVATPTTVPGTMPKGDKRLTTAQASLFARVLVKGHDDKGSHFSAIVPFGPAATFTIVGDVDWLGYQGSATLAAKRSDKKSVPNQQIFWSNGTLLQHVEGLEAAMDAKGRKGVHYVSRPISQNQAALDRVVILINSMSNTRAENPILLRQRNDVSFAGTTTIDNVSVERYRYGNTQYWLDAGGGLRKLIANFKSFSGPVEITFTDKGPKTLTMPAATEVVPATEIADVLKALTEVKSAPTNQAVPQSTP